MGIRTYNPYTPSRRNMTGSDFSEITKTTPEKSLLAKKSKTAGRNNQGKITVRHHGGGNRQKYRLIDFKRNKEGVPAKVIGIEYDPNRTANIALICYADGEKSYILAPQGLTDGMTVQNGAGAEVRVGNCLPLTEIPVGTQVHNIELYPGKGGQLVRSAGNSAQLMAKEGKYATLRLPSGEMRMVPIICRATIGVVGNGDHNLINLGKAGRKRHMGIRPTVRGSVMNPNDHPHGGGEGRAPVGRPSPMTPWGKPAMGLKTRKKKKASMVLGAQAVKEKKAGAVISAGNTGALLAAGLFVVGRIKGVERPGLMSTMPSFTGQPFDMLDLGANAENTSSHLHQYAILGSFYAKNVRGIANPRVGLLNNGTEETKGDSLRKEAFELLSKEPSINFVGNVEAREIMSGAADVVVADGFTGNAVLKAIEGTGLGAMKTLKSAIMNGGLKAKLGAFLLKDSLKGMKETMDYSSAGGAVLFGLKAPVVKCHGSSDAKAVYYTIKQVRTMLDTKVVEQLVEAFSPKEEAN